MKSIHQNKSIGIIDPKRLELIPHEYWNAHEFCFYIHDQILELLVQYEESGSHLWVANAFQKALGKKQSINKEINILQFMKEKGLVSLYKHHIVSHLVLGLMSDMLHFLYEALTCFEKRKFAVGFALLRKPLKENLLFLSWLLADQDDFITRFEANNCKTLNGLNPQKQLDILTGAINRLSIKNVFNAKVIHDLIFSKTNDIGFEPVWQKANHLITSQGELLKTEDYNINFIFQNPHSDNLYELLYLNLPLILIFAVQVSLECVAEILRVNDHTVSHLIISTMGCYEALFGDGRKQGVSKLLNKHLAPFLKCIHCESPLKIDRANAPKMYIREQISCNSCGLVSEFPLYWIMGTAKMTINRDSNNVPLLKRK